MALARGDKLGPYEILEPIGKGGMGEVWKAHDRRVGRDVAIKISGAQFSERFEREARAIAQLNHPNICTLFDVGPNYLVMELVEGPTLSERVKEGAIPLDETLTIARQIAEALEHAHDKGITHRDLKPSNIKVKPDGTVKVLDFGLAKVGRTSTMEPDESPTLTMTKTGAILGTPAYMSPEQAKGQPVDQRADVWAFGVVLYEMLTGKRPFRGETTNELLAAVLKEEPRWDRVPAPMQRLLRRLLEKDPRQRLRHVGDMMALIDDWPQSPAAGRRRPTMWVWTAAVLGALIAAVAVALWAPWREPPAAEQTRFQMPVPEGASNPAGLAVSPNGRYLAFNAAGPDGIRRLWLQGLDSLEARVLPGTENIIGVQFWSPDSRFIAFFATGKLKRAEIAGGPPLTVSDASAAFGSWSKDDVIVFPQGSGMRGGARSLMRVPASGGIPAPVREGNYGFPSFLPDGRHFLYLGRAGASNARVYVASLYSTKQAEQNPKEVVATVFGPSYAPSVDSGPGYVLFLREGTLLAQPFDERRLEAVGDPVSVAEQVGSFQFGGFFSASPSVLAYRLSATAQNSQLTWFDRGGKTLGKAGEPGAYLNVALSPDGTHAAVSRLESQTNLNSELWLIDLARGTPTRFTSGPSPSDYPVWSKDGSQIIFRVYRGGRYMLYRRPANGDKDEEMLLEIGGEVPSSWSSDGRYLLFRRYNGTTDQDLWVLPLTGDRRPISFLDTEFGEEGGQFSPDGHWVAYTSNESGRNEIYVREFSPTATAGSPAAGTPISKGGGIQARWRGDGKELFYLGPDRNLMTVDARMGPGFQSGPPKTLFQLPLGAVAWDVTADGKKFLVAVPLEQNLPPPFIVVQNWQAALRK
jgi:Tol biopolymer transport system component